MGAAPWQDFTGFRSRKQREEDEREQASAISYCQYSQ
jgi:hypothetical protein